MIYAQIGMFIEGLMRFILTFLAVCYVIAACILMGGGFIGAIFIIISKTIKLILTTLGVL